MRATRLVRSKFSKNSWIVYHFKEKNAKITNITSISSISHSMTRGVEIQFEVPNLSCFDSTSKQLRNMSYISRTSSITKLSLDLENWGRIEEMKIEKNHLQGATLELDSWCNSTWFLFTLLVEVQWNGNGNESLEFLFTNRNLTRARFQEKSSRYSILWSYGVH